MELGRAIDCGVIRRGLVGLNPDINFDPVTRLPSEWQAFFTEPGAASKRLREEESEPVYWGINYVTTLDRGMVPEFTLYELEDGIEEIPMQDLEKHENSSVLYYEILTTDPYFNEALTKAEAKSDNFYVDRGKVFKRQCVRMAQVQGRIIRTGWRRTFETLISFGIPGITAKALELKFGVSMALVTAGAPSISAPANF